MALISKIFFIVFPFFLTILLTNCSSNPYSESYAWAHFLSGAPISTLEVLYQDLGWYSRCLAGNREDKWNLVPNNTPDCSFQKKIFLNDLREYKYENVSLKPAIDYGVVSCMPSIPKMEKFARQLTLLVGGPKQNLININEYRQLCIEKFKLSIATVRK